MEIQLPLHVHEFYPDDNAAHFSLAVSFVPRHRWIAKKCACGYGVSIALFLDKPLYIEHRRDGQQIYTKSFIGDAQSQ